MNEWRALAGVDGGVLVGGRGEVKVLENGGLGLLLEVHFQAGVSSLEHHHGHDSYLYLLSGQISGMVGGEPFELQAGASLVHRAGVDHSVHAVVDSCWLEFKAPAPRLTIDPIGALGMTSDEVQEA